MMLVSSLLASALVLAVPAQVDPSNNRLAGLRLIDEVGRCVATKPGGEAKRLLLGDRQSPEYNAGLSRIAVEAQRDCVAAEFGDVDVTAFNKHLFAGAIAEHLLESSTETLEARLVALAPVEIRKQGDRDREIDKCIVRSSPKEVAALLAAGIGEAEEVSASEPLLAAYATCEISHGVPKQFAGVLEPAIFSLRAGLSLAALTLISAAETSN